MIDRTIRPQDYDLTIPAHLDQRKPKTRPTEAADRLGPGRPEIAQSDGAAGGSPAITSTREDL